MHLVDMDAPISWEPDNLLVLGDNALPVLDLLSRQNKGGKDHLSRAILP